MTVAWKEDHAWVLTRTRGAGELPEIYTFKENSSFDVIQGEIIIAEK